MHEQVEVTNGNFVEQKSRDLLSGAAVEPRGQEAYGLPHEIDEYEGSCGSGGLQRGGRDAAVLDQRDAQRHTPHGSAMCLEI
jgi:hypothetical protein